MADKLDETIREIASVHGVALGRDDPILMLQTMQERLLEESRKQHAGLLSRFAQELENSRTAWGETAKKQADSKLRQAREDATTVVAIEQLSVVASDLTVLLNKIEADLHSHKSNMEQIKLIFILICFAVLPTMTLFFFRLY